MSRSAALYRDGAAVPAGMAGFDPDVPTAGFYRMRLRSGGAFVGVRIWYGQPLDPDTREPMDRSLRFQAEINGRYAELDRVWPGCARDPIDEAEYRHLIKVQKWANQHAPGSGLDDPAGRRIDPLSSPLLF